MIPEIMPGIFLLEIPLPNSPLKSLNSYLIKGDGRYLIIDTGMNRIECRDKMNGYLRELGVDLGRTDFFVTHVHSDHVGLVGDLATGSSTVYCPADEIPILNSERMEEAWLKRLTILVENGFPREEARNALDSHPGRKYAPRAGVAFRPTRDGDVIAVGDYSFRCVDTRGHTPGHLCLYEPRKRLLLSGDHILVDITPNINYWLEMANPLKHYLASLDVVYDLDVETVLPGHRRIWHDHRQRIVELRQHHRTRLDEALAAVGDGGKTVYEIAPYLTWDIDCHSWDDFPLVQKWFAAGETLVHMVYLEEEGKVTRQMVNGLAIYRRS